MVNEQITIFRNIFDQTPHYTTVENALHRIQRGASRDKIEEIRGQMDAERSHNLKKNLPSVCFSGKFSARYDDKLIEHSGFMVLDFDKLKDLREKQTELINSPIVYACWISPRGNGLKVLVRIADGKKHREHFQALLEVFPDMDKACINESRVCYESYDPEIYINAQAQVFKKVKKTEKIALTESVGDKREIFERILKWLSNQGNAFVTGERNIFIFKLACACCRFGLSQEETLHNARNTVSFDSNTFTEQEAASAIRSAYRANKSKEGTASFDKEILVDNVTRSEIRIEASFTDLDERAKDVIFGEDVKKEALAIYDSGYEKIAGIGVTELDQHFKFRRGEISLLSGIGNYGKALCLNTKIPTPDGFTTMGDLNVGDVVFDEKGQECRVIRATEVMHGKKCYDVRFNDGSSIVACEDHLWLTSTEKARRSERMFKKNNKGTGKNDQSHKREFASVKTTKEIADSVLAQVGKSKVEYNHAVVLCSPVQYRTKHLEIHPYVFGAWLGDGCSDGGRITCNDDEILSSMQSLGYEVKKQAAKFMYGIKGIQSLLRSMNCLNNKHIPEKYLLSDFDQRLGLLQGLMDTDGHVSKYNQCEFTTIKVALANQVYRLVASLGIKATIVEGDARLNGRIISKKYRIIFSTTLPVFKISRKANRLTGKIKNTSRTIVSCKEVDSVPVRCIQVDSPSRLFLCTESFIPTHNTTFWFWMILMRVLKFKEKFAFFSPENNPAQEFYHDFVEILLGCDCTPANSGRPSKLIYERAYDFISKSIFYVYPKDIIPTPDYIKERFLELIIKEKVDGVIIDPFNQLANDYGKSARSDKYLETFLSDCSRFAQMNNVYFTLIAHPKLMRKESDGNYPCPDVFDIADGAMWNNKMDNILIYHRPNHQKEPNSASCELHAKKIRRQKSVGRKGYVEFEMFRPQRRYMFGGSDCMAKVIQELDLDFLYGQTEIQFNRTWLPYKDDTGVEIASF